MGEQSHKEAMREAIKGDLERARSRNPSIFERPAARLEPKPERAPLAVVPEPAPEPEPVAVVPEPEPVAEPEPQPEPVAAPEPPKRKRFRLLFWRS